MSKIIGLTGNLGCGKNYIAEKIILPYLKNALVIGFGDHVKIEYSRLKNVEYSLLFEKKDEETRKGLQKYATEENRHVFGEDTWINAIEMWIKVFLSRGCSKYFIIPDVRFDNEKEFIKKNKGILIKVDAPDRVWEKLMEETNGDIEKAKVIMSHSSEKGIKDEDCDFILNNKKDNIEFDSDKMLMLSMIFKSIDTESTTV